MKGLPRSFFARASDIVARELIGKVLSHKTKWGVTSGWIVETEAYFGNKDPASHAARRKTPRNQVMFGPPGHAYIYFCYGNHYLFNVVTEQEGVAGAVLVRALEPVKGVPLMLQRRKVTKEHLTTNGPGRLTQALGIGPEHNKQDLLQGTLVIQNSTCEKKIRIKQSGRIGIRNGTDLQHRYYWAGNPYVSAKPKN